MTDPDGLPDRHIIDILIEERAAELMARPTLWRLLKPVVYPLLDYQRARSVTDAVSTMRGLDIFRYLSELLRMDVQVEGIHHVPRTGGAILMPNHPAGISDGVAVFDALRGVREDLIFFANRDAIRAAPGLADVLIPVEWMDDKRTHERRKETVRSMIRAFRDERLVVIFPSGRLAQPTLGGLRERPWQPTAVNLAVKYELPIIPMHVKARNSWLYYLFYALHRELRDMTLFRELFNKTGAPYQITLGEPFHAHNVLPYYQDDLDVLTEALRRFVAEGMPAGRRKFVDRAGQADA